MASTSWYGEAIRQRAAAQQERRAGGGGAVIDALLAEAEPLDVHEQQTIIRELEAQHLAQQRSFRTLAGGFAAALAAFFAYAAAQQALHPWHTRYVGELRPVLRARTAAAVLLAQAAGLAAAAAALLMGRPPRGRAGARAAAAAAAAPASGTTRLLLSAALALGGAGCCYWGAAMRASIGRFGYEVGAKWELLWLPLGPLAAAGLCAYVVASLDATGRELQQLRRLAYDYKKV